MRASASVTISTGKNLKVDRYGKTRNPVLTTQWHGLKFWMPPPSQNNYITENITQYHVNFIDSSFCICRLWDLVCQQRLVEPALFVEHCLLTTYTKIYEIYSCICARTNKKAIDKKSYTNDSYIIHNLPRPSS